MMDLMHRTQINLEEWQYQALLARAQAEGRGLGALIREIVTDYLSPDLEERRRLLADITGVVEGPGGVAGNIDEVLYGPIRGRSEDQEAGS